MGRHATNNRKGRFRVRWFLSFAAVVVVGSCGSYVLYKFQRIRNTRWLLSEAKAAQQVGDVDKAIQSYQVYLTRNDSDHEALRVYADLLYEHLSSAPARLGETVRALRQLRQFDPTDVATLDRLAGLYSDLDEFGLAEEVGRAWVTLAPSSPDAVLALGRALHSLHKSDEAIALLTQASENAPGEPRFYPPLVAVLSESSDRLDEAARWMMRALENAPNNDQVQMAAFVFFLGRGESATAEQHLKKALDNAPENLTVLLAATRFYASTKKMDEAVVWLNRAIQLAPEDRNVLMARASVALSRGDRSAMIAVADDVMRSESPPDADVFAQAAELYIRGGDPTKAEFCIQQMEQIPSPDGRSRVSIDTLWGALYLARKEPYAAVPRLQRVLEHQPANLWPIELLARAYLQIGAVDEAGDLYRRLILLAPAESAPRLSLARIELESGHFIKVRDLMRGLVPDDANDKRQAELIAIAADQFQMAADGKQPSACEECRIALERTAANPPVDPGSIEILMRCLVSAGMPERAMDLLLNASIDTDAAKTIFADLGRRLLADGRADLAALLAEETIKRFSDDFEGHLLKIDVLIAAGRVGDARGYVEQCPLLDDQKGLLWAAIAEADPGKGTDDATDIRAIDALRQAARLMPRNITVRQKLVRRLTNVEEANKAVDEIRTLEGEGGVQWKYERAAVLLRLKPDSSSATESTALLRDCLVARPGWVEARMLLGFAQETAGKLVDAAESYRAAIAQKPELATDAVAIRLMEVLKRQGRYREADELLGPLALALPDSPDVLRSVTERHVRENDLRSAAASAERLLEVGTTDSAWAATTADLFLRSRQPEKAEKTARASHLKHPESVSLLTSLSRALFALGRQDEAENLVRKSAADRRDAPFDLLLARILLERNQPEEARRVMEAALSREPENPSLHVAASDFWGAQGDRARQMDLARKAIALRGESPATSLVLASLLAAGKGTTDRAEAEAIIRRRLADQPTDAQALLLDAQFALSADLPNVKKAEASLLAALKSDQRLVPAYKTLAAVQLQAGRLNAAEETTTAGLTVAPDDVDLLILKAEIHRQTGDYERALGPVQRALAIQPRNPRALSILVEASRQPGQLEQAIGFIEGLSPDTTRPAGESILLARLLETKGDVSRADALYRQILDGENRSAQFTLEYLAFQARQGAFDQVYALASKWYSDHPDDVETLASAAELLGAQSTDPDLRARGYEWLDEIAKNHPDNAADARYRSGLCRLQQGDLVDAETMLLRASQLSPDDPKPANALAWLYGEELGKPEQGLSIIEKFLADGGRTTPEMLDTHGTILLRMNRLKEAREKLSACLDMIGYSPTRTAATYHLGLVMMKSEEQRDGLTSIRLALDMNNRVGGLGEKDTQEARRLLNAAETKTP